jgi:hypothetical protein
MESDNFSMFFQNGGDITPTSAFKGCTRLFLLDYSQNLTRTIQKINLKATSLNLQWDEGVTIYQLTSSKKPNAFPNRQ